MRKYAFCFLCLLAFNANAATVIDTTSSWDGVMNTSSFGEGSTVTYGQTFVVTSTDNVLDSFSFWIDDSLNPDFIHFSAYVMEWEDGIGLQPSHAVGDILYQSGEQVTTNNGGIDGMEMFTFDTGGLQLETGKKYVAFMSSVEYIDGVHGSGSVGSVGRGSGDVYGAGDFVFQNSADTSQFTSGGWNVASASTVDLAFTATFSPVPIPAAVWLFSSGLIGLIGMARRKG